MADLDPSPELVVQAAYLQVFQKLRRWITYIAVAQVIVTGIGGSAIWISLVQRAQSHVDTQRQIRQLACGVVDQIPPDRGLADMLRLQYNCGPYRPPKAVIQPKPGHG